MGIDEVRAYLTDLAVNQNVSASTQSVAPSALPFLYKVVLETPLPEITQTIRAKQSKHLPAKAPVQPHGRELCSLDQAVYLLSRREASKRADMVRCACLTL